MKPIFFAISLSILVITFVSCTDKSPNRNAQGQDELESLEIEQPIVKSDIHYNNIIYVPIYSDIYFDDANQKNLLAATLSIRNTSYTDSLYVSKIDYFSTDGTLVKSYIDNPISLRPMASVNYVVATQDDTGGAGANFIVALSSKSTDLMPLVQAIMVGKNGNKGFAFSTDGYSIRQKQKKETP
ncbi:DUF3124 domain-containing protein [Aggregatimonas sangjinii]|uniref:DUF3124 domain-containing protein n=1 Tax=Aggregatimonas sangjinii TaxID=2583587 RepID=A0A5B7SYU3_9FLAO|nr:DUF3124 domain-containing protein [Aggregatimonas sangjinii]QCX01974.1 DUF3124 domain-containing protein [Aggregatimonas sangjinii]